SSAYSTMSWPCSDFQKHFSARITATPPIAARFLTRRGGGIRIRDQDIGRRPDARQAVSGANKQGRRRQADERQEQSVLDQILALPISNETDNPFLHKYPPTS